MNPIARDILSCMLIAAAKADITASTATMIGPRWHVFGPPREIPVQAHALDAAAQRQLWEESVRITGEDFGGL